MHGGSPIGQGRSRGAGQQQAGGAGGAVPGWRRSEEGRTGGAPRPREAKIAKAAPEPGSAWAGQPRAREATSEQQQALLAGRGCGRETESGRQPDRPQRAGGAASPRGRAFGQRGAAATTGASGRRSAGGPRRPSQGGVGSPRVCGPVRGDRALPALTGKTLRV